MKSLTQYIKEAKQPVIDTPLDAILDHEGRELAHLRTGIKVGNGFNNFSMDDVEKHCSKGIFKFKTVKDLNLFKETTASNDFWDAVYDYNTLTDKKPDYKHINELMKVYGNVIIGKTLYIYTPTNGDDDKETLKCINDLKTRCEKASKTFKFASYQFLA